jgi:BolA-like protein 3
MLSTVIRRVAPSLLRTRPYAAAAYTQAAASSASKLDEGEQAIYDKLSDRFQPSELLVQDVSGAPFQPRHSLNQFSTISV